MKNLLFGFFLIIAACNNTMTANPAHLDALRKLKEVKPYFEKYEAVVFIVSSGCSGCISTAEDLLIKQCRQNDTNKVLFVMVNYRSVKQARIRLGSDVVKNDNVIVDVENKFGAFLDQYPVAFFLDSSGEIEDVSAIKPGAESALFDKLNRLVD